MIAHTKILKRSQRMAATSMVCTWKVASGITPLISLKNQTPRSCSLMFHLSCFFLKWIELLLRRAFTIALYIKSFQDLVLYQQLVTQLTTSCSWSFQATKVKINGSRQESQSSLLSGIEKSISLQI